jgi:hypothetical protein
MGGSLPRWGSSAARQGRRELQGVWGSARAEVAQNFAWTSKHLHTTLAQVTQSALAQLAQLAQTHIS